MNILRIVGGVFYCILFVLVELQAPARAQGSASALWGNLPRGSYAVGYRVVAAFDESRTWRTTRTYSEPNFSPDLSGRPIRISIWYPAIAGSSKMRMKDYIYPAVPETFRAAEEAIEKRDARVIAEWVPPGEFEKLMQTPAAAYREAQPAPGEYPLVLYSAGVNAYTESNIVMAEFLASHGYVVATVPSLGESDAEPEQTIGILAVETSARDMEFAWSQLRQLPNVTKSGFGIVGHSLGGVVALLLAMRNSDVLAVAGLDGTYGFPEWRELVVGSYRYDPSRMQAALLDVRRANAQIDLQIPDAFLHSTRHFYTMGGMSHGDFTSLAMGAEAFHQVPPPNAPAGWGRKTGFRGYQLVCTAVLDFLDAKLRNDKLGLERLSRDLSGPAIVSTSYKPGTPLAPSVHEFLLLIRRDGVDAAVALAQRLQIGLPGETVVDEQAFNQAGYGFLADKQFEDAIKTLEFVVRVYPKSANAADSLGDAYLASGQKEKALAAFRRALELIPLDPGLNENGRNAIESDAKAKIQALAQ